MKKETVANSCVDFHEYDDVKSEPISLNQNKCYTKSNMFSILDISLFSTDNVVKISMRMSCNHGISALASIFVTKAPNTRVRNGLFGMCSK